MSKLLVICGPTATGKTSLALFLANKFDGELISADSRQVYKGADIATGKDLPSDAKWRFAEFSIGFWETKKGIKIWGYDLVGPKEDFSVGQYTKIACTIIEDIAKRGKLPILVGGTGLYIKGVVDGIATVSIPKDIELRKSLEGKSTKELFDMLTSIDSVKAKSLNDSDKNNPRRLIRAIEVLNSEKADKKHRSIKTTRVTNVKRDVLFIGLMAPKSLLVKRIKKRVSKRINQGIEAEIRKLIKGGVSWDMQVMNSLGYKQYKEYFVGNEARDEVIEKWVRQEQNYAKRQMTWFKKDKRINWFDITKRGWRTRVEKFIGKWHNDSGQ
jgi:tRNA dimethylallyltransferase